MNALTGNRGTTCVMMLLIAIVVSGPGCAIQPSSKQLLRLTESQLDIREMQTRTFAASSEGEILAATAAALQDMEYNIDQIEVPLGVITASKTSDADSLGEKTGRLLLDILCGCGMSQNSADKHRITITTVVLPSLTRDGIYVTRITIQQMTFSKMEKVVSRSFIDDPVAYQSIFEKLSKALHLEANEHA